MSAREDSEESKRSGEGSSDPPADVSDQNREEPSAPHPPDSGRAPEHDRADQPSDDGGQATGHPDNAG